MKVRKRKYKSGNIGWFVDLGQINGKRPRVCFETKEAADGHLREKRSQIKKMGALAHEITDSERLWFSDARARLADVGATMDAAVEFFLKHAKPKKGDVTLEAMVKAWIEAKEDDGQRGRYCKQIGYSTKSFVLLHGMRLTTEISGDQVSRWLKSNHWAPKTHNSYLGDLSACFNWGIKEGYATINPCEGVRRKRMDDGDIEFLSVEQCQILLDRAAEVRHSAWTRGKKRDGEDDEDFRDCLGAVVIGLFSGLRPEREVGLMNWKDVRGDVVAVSGHRAKTRGRRIVDLPENALEWLKLCPRREGRVWPKNFLRKWKRLRVACGLFEGGLVKKWPHDALRHTFATMHLAHFHDEAKLQVLMGHVDATMIYKHYRGQATPTEAAKFWALRPRLWGQALLRVD